MKRLLQYLLVFLFLFLPNLTKATLVNFFPFEEWGYANAYSLNGKEVKINDDITFSFYRNGSIVQNTPIYHSNEQKPGWGIIALHPKSYMEISVPDDYIIHQVIVNYSLENGSLKINSESSSDGNWIGYSNNVRIAAPNVETSNISPYTVNISAIYINYIPNIKSQNISLNNHSLTLYPCSQYTLSAELTPSNTTLKQIDWESSNSEVATVEEGVVTALAKGETIITAKNGTVSDSCKVTVINDNDWRMEPLFNIKVGSEDDTSSEAEKTLNGAYLLGTDILLREGQIPVIQFIPNVDLSVFPELEVTSNDNSIASGALADSPGSIRIMGIKKGECDYSVKIRGTDIIIATGKIKVISKIPIASIVLDPQKITLANGVTQFNIKADIQPEDATYKALDWSIDNTQAYRLVSEEDGVVLITVINGGNAVIQAKATDGTSAYGTCQISMIDIDESVIKVEALDARYIDGSHDSWFKETETGPVMFENTLILRENQKANFRVTVKNVDLIPTLKWETSNDIAQVNNVSKDGLEATVIGKKSGMSNFNIYFNNRKINNIYRGDILVVRENNSIVINPHELTLNINQQEPLSARLFIKEARDTTISWHSGNLEIASVAENGIVTGKGLGETFVVASCGELTDTCWVTVNKGFLFDAMEDFRLKDTGFPNTGSSIPTSYRSNYTGFKYTFSGSNVGSSLVINRSSFTDPFLEFSLPFDCLAIDFYTTTLASDILEIYADDNLIWSAKLAQTTKYKVEIPSEYQVLGTKYKFVPKSGRLGFYYFNYTLRQPVDLNPVLLNYNQMTLLIGESLQLEGFLPSYATQDNGFKWVSENKDVAEVSESGMVTAKKSGQTNIVVTNGKFQSVCKIKVQALFTYSLQENFNSSKCGMPYVSSSTVKEVSSQLTGINYIIKNVNINSSSKDLYLKGEMSFDLPDDLYQLKLATTTADERDPHISLYADRELIGIYDLNYKTVLAISIPPQYRKKGTIYKLVSEKSYNQRFSAFGYVLLKNPVEPENLILNSEKLSLNIGEIFLLNATVMPNDVTDKTIVWSSSNEEIATVSNYGKVTAIDLGEAIITASCGEVSATCEVTVLPVKAEEIILSHEYVELESGHSHQLTATVNPSHTTHKTIVWSSSDPTVAEVDNNGLVMAKNIGTTDIKAQCGEVSAICTITVSSSTIDPESIKLNIVQAELNIGETVQLEANVIPENATNKTVTWSSSVPEVASVSQTGLVTAMTAGNTEITVSCGDVSAACFITVTEDSGVDSLDSLLANPESKISVFSPTGILIKKDCKIEDLKTLNKGIYIIVSGKERYKIYI